MKRLILTTSDAGAGWLQQAKIADRVEALAHRLLPGRPPTTSETAAFFAPRHDAQGDDFHHWQNWISISDRRRFGRSGPGLVETCRKFDAIELWIDPGPHAQLVLLQLLDFLRPHGEIVRKLVLRQADGRIGERGTEHIPHWTPPAETVGFHHLETARLAWDAFRAPTPEAWCDLQTRDLAALPYLRRSVLTLLDELPAVGTALGATERILLTLISPGGPVPFYSPGYRRIIDLGVFDYWEVGQALDRLAHCPCPAVLGLDEGPFTLALHDDGGRYQRYKASRLSLSPLGQALLEDREDFSRHNPIHRWWGGTELTRDRLWRWDASNAALIPPAP